MIKIVSWNVNGIRAVDRKGAFMPVVNQLKPDILCLQETKAEQHQSPIDLSDYDELWNSAQNKKGYSGTAIFTKHQPTSVFYNLPKKIVKKYSIKDDGYGDPNQEGRVITAEFESFYVVNVYTPNSKPNLERLILRHKHWDAAILDYLIQLQKDKPVILCGDFNVAYTEDDLANPKANEGNTGFTKEERAGIKNIINAGFIDTFREFKTGNGFYTWWSHWAKSRERNIGWRIDYIFISKSLKNKLTNADIHPEFLGSDHCPISIDISVNN